MIRATPDDAFGLQIMCDRCGTLVDKIEIERRQFDLDTTIITAYCHGQSDTMRITAAELVDHQDLSHQFRSQTGLAFAVRKLPS